MILQALYEYYQRKASDPESNIAPEGWEWKDIPFLILISGKGLFISLVDTREQDHGKAKAKRFLVPHGAVRTGPNAWKQTNLLWDHYGYLFGHPKTDSQKDKDMAAKQFSVFIEKIQFLNDKFAGDNLFNAVKAFYDNGEYKKIFCDEKWSECAKITGCNLSFCIDQQENIIFNSQTIQDFVSSQIDKIKTEDDDANNAASIEGICLITGEKDIIKRTHSRTPINKDTKSLIAIQRSSGYDSYGKTQAYNSPIGQKAEFAYTTALNTLLQNRDNRFQLADASVVFWAEKKKDLAFNLEDHFKWYIDDSPGDDPDKGIHSVKALYNSFNSGNLEFDDGNRFYVLGLAPNSARISVRFWKIGTVGDFSNKIKQHFDDFDIVRSEKDPEYLSLGRILRSIVLEYKMDNVPPNLAGKVVESILDGAPYPETLLNLCINRIRAERHVTRARAAIIKAYLNRHNRYYKRNDKEVLMSLDRTNVNIGYRIGRLFAVLEKIDEEGGSGTIRERFYSAASSSPATVFSRLLTLKNHHLAKLENQGRKVNFEKELGEIFEGITDFPSHLLLKEQGLFAIGYYHQKQNYYTPKSENQEKEI